MYMFKKTFSKYTFRFFSYFTVTFHFPIWVNSNEADNSHKNLPNIGLFFAIRNRKKSILEKLNF